MDIDPRHKGNECWASGGGLKGLYNCKGEKISDARPRSCNMGVWWDDDLLREILDGKHDGLPEQAFYMVGDIESAVEKAKTLA